MTRVHDERHRASRIGWLRAAVLGANDGVISTASLMVGVAATGAAPSAVLTAGIAGLGAGAMSMAAGEYVSVQSQADTEQADIARETRELETQPELERAELVAIYRRRGLDEELATRVAERLMAHDALAAHVRDELGISEALRARPMQAAIASAAAFAVGAVLPVAAALGFRDHVTVWITSTSLIALVGLGGIAAHAGGASIFRGALRVASWGGLAMGLTAGVGRLFGTVD
jgi:VIT1/CCC1 family predicted Fe2+/Mn2+ transporter